LKTSAINLPLHTGHTPQYEMISTLQKVKSQLQLIDSTTNKTSNYVYRYV